MKKLILAICSLLLTTLAHAQWKTTTYTLKGGWNAIYLHGDASYDTIDNLITNTNVTEIWRWNSNPSQVGYTATPSAPTPNTPEWSTWVRGADTGTLTQLTGQCAYLVKCSGTANSTFSVSIPQKPKPPTATWVRAGANLMGFPTKLNGNSYPTFTSYFATFPASIASNTKVYQYIGGDLGSTNPAPLFSTSSDRIDRNKAYWFSSEVTGNFYAPAQITLSLASGFDYGRTGSIITARVMNRNKVAMTLNIAPELSEQAPGGQEAVTAKVPITRRSLGSDGVWTESLIGGAYTETIAANASVELSFGIDRTQMTTPAGNAFYASLLRFSDTGNQFDILMPVTARKTSLAGLWVGEATVMAVESKAQSNTVKPTAGGFPLRYLLHVTDDGKARVLSQVFLGSLAAGTHDFGICTRESDLQVAAKATAMRMVSTHLPLDRVLDGEADAGEPAGSGSVAIPGNLTRTIVVPYDDPANPFVHQYHPDHDNKDANGAQIGPNIESYDITREVRFNFTPAPPAGSGVTRAWGSNVIGGNYFETVTGLHRQTIQLSGTFELKRISELGSIVTP